MKYVLLLFVLTAGDGGHVGYMRGFEAQKACQDYAKWALADPRKLFESAACVEWDKFSKSNLLVEKQ